MNVADQRPGPKLFATHAPRSIDEVAEIVRRAAERGQAVYPIGAGTQADVGCLPRRPGIGLSLAALDRLIDYQPDDMTITVEAGMKLDRLRRVLAERGQWLPIDFASPDGTLGGALAVGLCGPRRFGFGGWADYVLGLRAVDGQGNVFFSGAKVVKSAAGLNVHRLLIGSLGALAIVAEATLMVRPRPEMQAGLACRVSDPAAADRLLDALSRSRLTPSAADLYSSALWEQLSGREPTGGPVLVVGFAGAAADVEWMLDGLRQQCREAGVPFDAIERVEKFDALCEAAAAWPAEVGVAVRPSRLCAVMARLGGVMTELPWQARAGDGMLLLRVGPRTPAVWESFVRDRIMAPAAEEPSARVAVIRPPEGSAFAPAEAWGFSEDETVVWTALKEKFDPKAILNPGRFPGAIAAAGAPGASPSDRPATNGPATPGISAATTAGR